MHSLKLLPHCAVLCLVAGFMALTSAETTIEFKVGSDVILPCQGPKTGVPAVFEWQKEGQKDYVIKYQEGKALDSLQNHSYRGRVKLVDQQMTNGDLSIKLSNATQVDEGRYTCLIFTGTETKTTVQLKAEQDTPNGNGNDNLGLKVGLSVGLLLAVGALIGGFLFVRSKKGESTL